MWMKLPEGVDFNEAISTVASLQGLIWNLYRNFLLEFTSAGAKFLFANYALTDPCQQRDWSKLSSREWEWNDTHPVKPDLSLSAISL